MDAWRTRGAQVVRLYTHLSPRTDGSFSWFDDDKQTIGALQLVRSVEEEVVWLYALQFTPESASDDRSRFQSRTRWFDHADHAFAITHQGEMLVMRPVEVAVE